MLHKKLLAMLLTFTFGLSLTVVAEIPESPEATTPAEEPDERSVEETPTLETSITISDSDLTIFGGEIQETGGYLRKTYNSFSLVPGTWRWMAKEMEEGSPLAAAFVGIFVLPADFTLSRLYGNFRGSYYFGRAGDPLIASSRVMPSEQAVLIERSGNDLKTCRTFGLFSNALFYGGLSAAVVKYYGTLFEEEGEETSDVSYTYETIAMAAGYGLRLLSVHYAGSAGRRLEELSMSSPSTEPLVAMGEAGRSLRDYRNYTYWGYGLTALGITLAVAGEDNDTLLATGILTTLGGWIVSSPVAVNSIKAAAEKLHEAGDRMMYWREQ